MNNRRSIIVLGLMLLATVALAAGVVLAREGYLYEKIVLPISYLMWIFGLLLRGTPQALFWGMLLVITLVLFLRSLSVAPPRQPVGMPLENTYSRRPRLRHWVRQILMSRNERYRRYLYEGLGRLALEVLAHQRGITVNQYQQQIDANQEQPPEIIIPFLEARRPQYRPQESFDFPKILSWLQRRMYTLPFFRRALPEQDLDLNELVEFLERQMGLE